MIAAKLCVCVYIYDKSISKYCWKERWYNMVLDC